MENENQLSPLSEKCFFVLCVINLNDKIHGYKIISEVDRLSEGKIQVAFSSLYTMLRKFEQEGIIFVYKRNETGTKTIYYQITDKGKTLLESEAIRMQKLIALVALRKDDNIEKK